METYFTDKLLMDQPFTLLVGDRYFPEEYIDIHTI